MLQRTEQGRWPRPQRTKSSSPRQPSRSNFSAIIDERVTGFGMAALPSLGYHGLEEEERRSLHSLGAMAFSQLKCEQHVHSR